MRAAVIWTAAIDCVLLLPFVCADDISQIIYELNEVIGLVGLIDGLIGRGDAGTASGGAILIYKV
jgi:hypothetical protein